MMLALPTIDRHTSRRMSLDLKTLVEFVNVFCSNRHATNDKACFEMKTHDVREIFGQEISLCPSCTKLLAHALTKRSHCPMYPKPACKNCPSHCYSPFYREGIREVMQYSGRKLVLSGRLDYLFHLLF